MFLLNWHCKRESRLFNLSLQAPSWVWLILFLCWLTHYGLRSHYVNQYTRAHGCQKAIFFSPEGLTQGTNSQTWSCATNSAIPRVDIFVSHNPGNKTQLIGHITQCLNQLLGSSQSAEIKYSINVMKLIKVVPKIPLIKVVPKITQRRILDVTYFALPVH